MTQLRFIDDLWSNETWYKPGVGVEIGIAGWTEGHFSRRSALDDLGLESVGAGLLRRLIPGVLQTTGNAGYYAFYSYLLAKWEQEAQSVFRADFKAFYRRQEAAYAVACVLHTHRGPLSGIQGSNGANAAVAASSETMNVGRLADDYMDSPYGGYGLFYARVLEDIRLTTAGARAYVDRVTETGKAVADAFAQAFEGTRYYRDYFDADIVPLEVLAELGAATCSCTIPSRPDQTLLIETFFGEREEDAVWAARRTVRVESLSLFLDYHRQRPAGADSDTRSFRRVLAHGRFADGTELSTPFQERLNSWRAYQFRECETLVLTTLWSWYLRRLEQLEPVTHTTLRDNIVASVDWPTVEFLPSMTVRDATTTAAAALPDGAALVEAAYATADDSDEPGRPVAAGLRALLALANAAADTDPGFAELRDEGGPGRWSLAYLRQWFDLHAEQSVEMATRALFDELHYQHIRVAMPKLSSTDHRDPFCFAEDDGVLRLLRTDEPFWTAARFGVVNHLLWTLGLLTAPEVDPRPTPLGVQTLTQAYRYAQPA